jgi:RND family efflux transporter MFP subunit
MRKFFDKRTWIADKRIIGGLLAIVLMAAGMTTVSFGKSKHEAKAGKEEAPVPVQVVTVEPRKIDAVVSAVGTLSSRNVSVLSSRVMGKIMALTVKEGDHVSQGRLLMKIESGEIAAQVYQAQAAYNNAKIQYDRIKKLYDEKASTQIEMDQATLGLETATAGLNAAKAMESYTTILAPISGQIVEKKINVGEMALPGQPMLKIEDNRALRLEATLNEQDIRFVRPGQTVTVRMDALPDQDIRGHVSQVVPAADIRTHSFIVKIDIPADRSLVTGMYGKALFSRGMRDAIMVPRSAIVELGGLKGVYIVTPEENAVFQMVQPGEVQGDSVEALTGLKAGDRLVVSRHETSIDGRKVVEAQK